MAFQFVIFISHVPTLDGSLKGWLGGLDKLEQHGYQRIMEVIRVIPSQEYQHGIRRVGMGRVMAKELANTRIQARPIFFAASKLEFKCRQDARDS